MMTNEEIKNAINSLAKHFHEQNVAAGWWTDLATGQRKERNKGELICLIHSELSEAMEGVRKNLNDDKLPHRKMEQVEMCDVAIRLFDYMGAYYADNGECLVEKAEYNRNRADHKIENRVKEGGKAF